MPRSGILVICSRATLSCDSSYSVMLGISHRFLGITSTFFFWGGGGGKCFFVRGGGGVQKTSLKWCYSNSFRHHEKNAGLKKSSHRHKEIKGDHHQDIT